MLSIVPLEQLELQLLQVSQLVYAFEREDLAYPDAVIEWLNKVDTILQQNRLPIAGKISTYRGKIHKLKKGEGLEAYLKGKRKSKKKILNMASLEILTEVTHILDALVEKERARMDEAIKLAKQLIPIGEHYALLHSLSENGNQDALSQIKYLISRLKEHEATQHGVIQLEGLISANDMTIIFGRALREYLAGAVRV